MIETNIEVKLLSHSRQLFHVRNFVAEILCQSSLMYVTSLASNHVPFAENARKNPYAIKFKASTARPEILASRNIYF